MCLKCKEEVINPTTQVNFVDNWYNGIVFELSLFTTNIKKKVVGVLEFFFFFKKIWKKKLSQIVKSMLDPRFKSFYFLFSFIVHEEGVNIEYDRGSL
jgi:hypothetical protein